MVDRSGGRGLVLAQGAVESVKRRAIRTYFLSIRTNIEIHMRMIEGRVCSDAHELLDANLDHAVTGIVLEMRYTVPGHDLLRQLLPPAYINEFQPLSCAESTSFHGLPFDNRTVIFLNYDLPHNWCNDGL
jgi:hypothetical protein